MSATILRTLTSPTLARRFARILDERARCRLHAARLWRRRRRYAARLADLLARAPGDDVPTDRRFAGVDDDFWFWLIRQRYFHPERLPPGLLPGFPEEAIQVRFTGNAGALMLWQAFSAYRLLRSLAAAHGRPVTGCGAVLDFGCGWGRIIRFFQKDVAADRLWGVDVDPDMIARCRRQDRRSRFEIVPARGPAPFADATFDLVFSFSVFSHFAEDLHATWLGELRRILRPGGLLLATTRRRDFIEQSVLDRLRRPLSRHPGAIAGMFADTRRWLAAYDEGRYCHEPQAGMEGWGETCIPRPYVERRWTEHFTVLDFVDDPRRCTQNVIVARRP